MRRRPLLIALFGLALVLLGWLVLLRPWIERAVPIATTTPGLNPLFTRSEIAVPGGSTACVAPVRLDPAAGRAQLLLVARHGPAPLHIIVSAPGYRAVATGAAAGTGGDEQLTVPFRPPTRAVDGRVCVLNAGRHGIALVGTSEARSVTRSNTTVDGATPADGGHAVLEILEPRDRSPGASLGELARHLSQLTGGMAPAWLVWVTGLLLLLGVPFALFGALAVALREDGGG